jgi:hypothetical protein
MWEELRERHQPRRPVAKAKPDSPRPTGVAIPGQRMDFTGEQVNSASTDSPCRATIWMRRTSGDQGVKRRPVAAL